jgi:hypothetical protein
VSNSPPSGAMATPPTAATSGGDLNVPFETSRTTRVTNTLERMLGQILSHPAASTVPDHRVSTPRPRRRPESFGKHGHPSNASYRLAEQALDVDRRLKCLPAVSESVTLFLDALSVT